MSSPPGGRKEAVKSLGDKELRGAARNEDDSGTWCSSRTGSLNGEEDASVGSKNQQPIGRWITNEEEIGEHVSFAPALPMDVSFILKNEVDLVLPVVVKDDFQKADNAAAPTQLWSFFFKESFLNRFQKGRARPGPWQVNNVDPCRRHAWDRREGMPPGWEKAMNGFRRLGLRWWRRNLLRTFRAWREKHHPVDSSLITRDPLKGRNRPPHSLVTRNVDGTYDWKKELQDRNSSKA